MVRSRRDVEISMVMISNLAIISVLRLGVASAQDAELSHYKDHTAPESAPPNCIPPCSPPLLRKPELIWFFFKQHKSTGVCQLLGVISTHTRYPFISYIFITSSREELIVEVSFVVGTRVRNETSRRGFLQTSGTIYPGVNSGLSRDASVIYLFFLNCNYFEGRESDE